jgi:hypothetical protein
MDADRLLRLIGYEIEEEDADFVNIFRRTNDKKEFLLITSVSTWALMSGLFRAQVRWTLRHDEVEDAAVERGTLHGYVFHDLVLEAAGDRYEFRFGLNDPSGASAMPREITEQNARLALHEITELVKASRKTSADPDLETSHRSRALVEAEPDCDTESSDGWTPGDYAHLVAWMRGAKPRDVWERRVALGYRLQQNDAVQKDWFWVNALPALAGLRLGLKEHPFVAMCAGIADQTVDRGNAYQMKAITEINQQFLAD